MLLFFFILTIIFNFIKTDEHSKTANSTITYIDDDLKEYETKRFKLLRNLQQFKCIDSINSCSNHGQCDPNNTTCFCQPGYSTYPMDSNPQCNYVQKKQLVAFLCELFLGFGAGHFYTERYTHAGLKLGAFLFGIYIICLFPLSAKYLNDRCESDYLVIMVSCFYYCCAVGLATWFIYDLVQFGSNNYYDGNNVPLLSWSVQSNT